MNQVDFDDVVGKSSDEIFAILHQHYPEACANIAFYEQQHFPSEEVRYRTALDLVVNQVWIND